MPTTRSRSCNLDIICLVGRKPNNNLKRTRSLPKAAMSQATGFFFHDSSCLRHQQENPDHSAVPPSLNRWSSSPAYDRSLENACNVDAATARSMWTLRFLPPRLPVRRSGKAAELRSALPPQFPRRKPGDATTASDALPPFMPMRKSDEPEISILNSFAFCNNASFVSQLGDSSSDYDDSDSDGESASTDRLTLRQVLASALDQLNEDLTDDDDVF